MAWLQLCSVGIKRALFGGVWPHINVRAAYTDCQLSNYFHCSLGLPAGDGMGGVSDKHIAVSSAIAHLSVLFPFMALPCRRRHGRRE